MSWYLKEVSILMVFATCVASMPIIASEENQLPEFSKLRFDENYSTLQNANRQSDFIRSLKHISLSNKSGGYVSVGGEARLRYEYTHNPGFGEYLQDKRGVLLQRYVIHTDVRFDKNMRFFIQLASVLEAGRNGGPSPVDENKLEFQNSFFDYSFDTDTPHQATLRLGRQEVNLGSGRLVDVREGPNVRRTFDGARVILQDEKWNSSILAIRPRLTYPGMFDDRSDKEKTLLGLYTVVPYRQEINNQFDYYYLGFKDDSSSYEQGTDKEKRHSVGIRVSAETNLFDYNWEYIYQFGTFGDGVIRAWSLATETGYQWKNTPWRPRLALNANIASGDKNPDNPDLESFNALFPRGNYFSEAAILGPRNFYNLHPYLTIHPDGNWSFTTGINFFWRKETSDGVYGPSGQLIRSSSGSSERFVGTAISLNSEWSISRELTLTAVYAHWFPGKFLKDTGSSEPTDFIELTAQYKF